MIVKCPYCFLDYGKETNAKKKQYLNHLIDFHSTEIQTQNDPKKIKCYCELTITTTKKVEFKNTLDQHFKRHHPDGKQIETNSKSKKRKLIEISDDESEEPMEIDTIPDPTSAEQSQILYFESIPGTSSSSQGLVNSFAQMV